MYIKSTGGSFQGYFKSQAYMQKITNFVEEDLTISMFINFNQGHCISKGYVYVPLSYTNWPTITLSTYNL